jgi:mannose-1-phosphate guanylyltransferase
VEIYSEDRPWGGFEKFHENKPCTVKLIYINPDSRLSLQYHKQRWEFWKVVRGVAEVELEEKIFTLKERDTMVIPTGAKHRIKAIGEQCIILEISYGMFNEDDIVRLEDDYRRTNSNRPITP